MPLGSSGSSLFYHLRVNRAELNWDRAQSGRAAIGQAAIGQAAIGQAAIGQAA